MKSKSKRHKARIEQLLHLTRLAEMGRLAASVAHEINNPLMVAQGFAENIELLLDGHQLDKDEVRIQVLEIIKSCQRMARIVNKMNRMSRSQRLRLHVVDLAEVALSAVDFLKTQLDGVDATLEFKFDHPVPIKCDVLQVEQIILNILTNAIHALERCKRKRKIRISFESVGRWQQIKVWNNGPSIPDAVQAQLMTPFFTTKAEGEGTGLGLAVSQAIMQVHGGQLSWKSNPKFGTEFTLSFPSPKSNPWQAQARQNSGRIVIIDHQPNYRQTLKQKFHLLGYQVDTFSDFSGGYQSLEASPGNVKAVFLDIIPGHPQSKAHVRELRRHLGPSVLIFAISHYPSARDLKGELRLAGASEFFEKPIHADSFQFILKQIDQAVLDAPRKSAA